MKSGELDKIRGILNKTFPAIAAEIDHATHSSERAQMDDSQVAWTEKDRRQNTTDRRRR